MVWQRANKTRSTGLRRHVAATLVLAIVGLGNVAGARGHFLWTVIEPTADGQTQAVLWFNEPCAPGAAHLVEKMTTAEATLRPASGAAEKLALHAKIDGDDGAMVAPIVDAKDKELTARWQYGVFDHGEEPVLLNYYARYQDAKAPAVDRSGDNVLPLDLIALPGDNGTTKLRLTWNGKPENGATVYVNGPTEVEELTTDADGEVQLAALKPGLFGFRAKHIEPTPGEKDGKPYASVAHWSTLTLRTGEKDAAASKQAADTLENARLGRALWNGFPGFTCKVTVNNAGKISEGQLAVSAEGDVKLSGIEDKGLQMMLDSLVSHRLSGADRDDDVSFGDDNVDHPLGRLINLDYDTAMGSAYRIKDDVVTEVNRNGDDGGRFTISVLDVYRNAEGKYLPSVYTINAWDKDGALQSSIVTQDRWASIDGYDLPMAQTMIRSAKGQQQVRMVTFSDHQMLPQK